jgi:predicted AAA+ superfamily ATPase
MLVKSHERELSMDYSTGILNTMSSNFFPVLRKELGPYLVDKTKLIENIVDDGRLVRHVDLVLRPRRCGKSTMLQML